MKLTIEGREYPFVPIGQWTYEEADEALRVSGLTTGGTAVGLMEGDHRASLAFATIGWLRSKREGDPIALRAMAIDQIEVDPYAAPEPDEPEADADPPAEGADEGAETSEPDVESVSPPES